ncbi:MAG: hypothetical protein WCC93_07240, partial [Chthoniobacterales bacterium]
MKAGNPLASIKNANSSVHTKCSHYISIPCLIALIQKFSVIHKIDLALYAFFVSICANPVVLSAQLFHNENGTPLALNPLKVHISASPDPAKILIIDDEIGPRESLRML